MHHVVGVEHAELLLAVREARDLLAERHRRPQEEGLRLEGLGSLEAEAPEKKTSLRIMTTFSCEGILERG